MQMVPQPLPHPCALQLPDPSPISNLDNIAFVKTSQSKKETHDNSSTQEKVTDVTTNPSTQTKPLVLFLLIPHLNRKSHRMLPPRHHLIQKSTMMIFLMMRNHL